MKDGENLVKENDKLISKINKMLDTKLPNKFWERIDGATYSESYSKAFTKDLERIKEASVEFEKVYDMDSNLIIDLGKLSNTQKIKGMVKEKLFNESARNMYIEDEIILESKLSTKEAYTSGIENARKKLIETIYKDYKYTGTYAEEKRLFASKSADDMLSKRIRLWNTVKVADVFKFFSKDEMSSFIGGGSLAFKTDYWSASAKVGAKVSSTLDKIFGDDAAKINDKLKFKAEAYTNFNLHYARSFKGKGTILLWSTLATNSGNMSLFPVYLKIPALIVDHTIEADAAAGFKAAIGGSKVCDISSEDGGFAKSYLDARLISAMYSKHVKTLVASPVYKKSNYDALITDNEDKKKLGKKMFQDQSNYYIGDEYKYLIFTDSENSNVLAREYSYPDIEATFFNKQLQLSYRERTRLKVVIDSLKGKGVATFKKESEYREADIFKYPFYKESKTDKVYGLKILETSAKISTKPKEISEDLSNIDNYQKVLEWYKEKVEESNKFPVMHIPEVVNLIGDVDVKLAVTLGLYRMGGASSTKTISISLPFSTKFNPQVTGKRNFSSATDSLGKVFQNQYKTSGKLKSITENNVINSGEKTSLLKSYRNDMADYVDVFVKNEKIHDKSDEIDFITALTGSSESLKNKGLNYGVNIADPSFQLDDQQMSSETIIPMDESININSDEADFVYKQFSFVNYIKNGEIQEFKGDKEKVSKFLYTDLNIGSNEKKDKDDVDQLMEKDCYFVATERNSAGYISFNGAWNLSGSNPIFDQNLSSLTIGSSIPISKIKSLFLKADNLYDKYNIDFFSIFNKLDLEKTSSYAIYDFSVAVTLNALKGNEDLYRVTKEDRAEYAEYKKRNLKCMREWINFVLNDYSNIFNNLKFDSDRNFAKKTFYDIFNRDYKSFRSWIEDRLRKLDDLLVTEFKTYLSTLSKCSKELARNKDSLATVEDNDVILKAVRECILLNNSINKKVVTLLEKIKLLGINNKLNDVTISESHLKLINVIRIATETHAKLFLEEVASVSEETNYSSENTFELYCMLSECVLAAKEFGDYASNVALPIDQFLNLLSKHIGEDTENKKSSDTIIEILFNYENLGVDSIFLETIWDCSELLKIHSDLEKVINCVTNKSKTININEAEITNILAKIPASIKEAVKSKKDIVGNAYIGFRVLKPSANKNSDSVTFPIGLTFNPIKGDLNIKHGLPLPLVPNEINIPGCFPLTGVPSVSKVIDKLASAEASLKLELAQTNEKGTICLELLLNVPKNNKVDLNHRLRPIINI
ncbi:hypothetical protein ACFPDQ_03775 [Pseudofrancisella aestuarii]|uniref:Toxin n=1 Tax=Pseudofrancisella aestuarii TaxID=2670347 RepID=A0ABV9TB84_9GAMM|nr:hypothetical protein [Pseudofrancisella aestuarii]